MTFQGQGTHLHSRSWSDWFHCDHKKGTCITFHLPSIQCSKAKTKTTCPIPRPQQGGSKPI